jgi:hypothetical protein
MPASSTQSPNPPRHLIWAGTNDGLVQATRDAGKTWTNVTKNIPNLPPWGSIRSIEPSRYDAGTAYLTVDFHQVNNRDPFAYKTADYGQTWKRITNGIPHSMLSYAHCIREDPVRRGLLFLGTENAIYVSFDDGENWQLLQMNLPHAPVYWISIQERFHDLVIATYGRGFWILDDLTPLEQMTPQTLSADAHLFAPREAYRFREITPVSTPYDDPTTGEDPPYGADINYYLKAPSAGSVTATILDQHGQRVDHRGSASNESALCAIRARGAGSLRSAPGAGRLSILAPPGTYTVKLSIGGRDLTQTLTVSTPTRLLSGVESLPVVFRQRDRRGSRSPSLDGARWLGKTATVVVCLGCCGPHGAGEADQLFTTAVVRLRSGAPQVELRSVIDGLTHVDRPSRRRSGADCDTTTAHSAGR